MRNCLFCGIGVGVVLLIVAAVLGWAVFPGIIESRIADVSKKSTKVQQSIFKNTLLCGWDMYIKSVHRATE